MTTRNDTGLQGYCGFEVGQHVLFTNDRGWAEQLRAGGANSSLRKMIRPVVGKVYTIRAIYIDPHYQLPFLLLSEIRNPPLEWRLGTYESGFSARRFRPLPKLRVEDFLAASTPKDVVGRVPA